MSLETLHAALSLQNVDLTNVGDDLRQLRQKATASATIEEYLALISAKMDIEGSLSRICSCFNLIVEFLNLVADYSKVHEVQTTLVVHKTPVSHRSYEYVLYILLGIAEKSSALKKVVDDLESRDEQLLNSFFAALGGVISSDTYYFTQEMALEVVGRLSFLFLTANKKARNQELIRTLSPMLKTQLTDKKTIQGLLRDMRPLLNKINESNVNIITFPLAGVALSLDNNIVATSSWLDISKSEMFCFYSDKYEIYFKFPFVTVQSCIHTLQLELEIKLKEFPEVYRPILPNIEGIQTLKITFMDEEDVLESRYFFDSPGHASVLNQPLAEKKDEETISSLSYPEMLTDEQMLRGHKISVTRASKRESIVLAKDSLLKLLHPSLMNKMTKSPNDSFKVSSFRKPEIASVKGTVAAGETKKRGRKRKDSAVNSSRPTLRRTPVKETTDDVPQYPSPAGIAPAYDDNMSYNYDDHDDYQSIANNVSAAKLTAKSPYPKTVGNAPEQRTPAPVQQRSDAMSVTSSVTTARRAKMRRSDEDGKLPLQSVSKQVEDVKPEQPPKKLKVAEKPPGIKGPGRPPKVSNSQEKNAAKDKAIAPIPTADFDYEPPIDEGFMYDIPSQSFSPVGSENILNDSSAHRTKPINIDRVGRWEDDTISKASSSFLGKRKYGSASNTPRKPVLLSRGLPLYDSREPPFAATALPATAALTAKNEQAASAVPATSKPTPIRARKSNMQTEQMQNNKTTSKASVSGSNFAATTAPVDKFKGRPDHSLSKMEPPPPVLLASYTKRKPLQEIPSRTLANSSSRNNATAASYAPAVANYYSNMPDHEESDFQFQPLAPISPKNRNVVNDTTDKAARKDRQRAALLTLSQQIEEMAPALDDTDDYGGNAAYREDNNSATSFADESSVALSRILQELQAFQKPKAISTNKPAKERGRDSKQKKRLRNIANSSHDQLHAYVSQVKHYLSFYLKDTEHSLRTNYDTLCYSLNATVQPNLIVQEAKTAQELAQQVDNHYQDVLAHFGAFKSAIQDTRAQDREAVLSFRKSLTQSRHSHRSRAVTKLRNVPSSNASVNTAPSAGDLRALIGGGRNVDIAALLRG